MSGCGRKAAGAARTKGSKDTVEARSIGALIGVVFTLAVGPAIAQAPPQTDQTVTVARGARLTVNNYAGEVIVKAWDRDAVRVQARHAASKTRVSVRTVQGGIAVSASGASGPPSVDYEINVPAWMPVKIDGHYAYIAVEGTQGEVTAETVRGDVAIKGGTTFVSAKSIEGGITVEGAKGRIIVSSVSQGISVTRSSGEIMAETVNGPIKLSGIEAEAVEAGTINGQLTYDGTPAPRGRYRFSTHNGNIVVAIPESANVTFTVRTYNGSLNTSLPAQRSGDVGRGRRATYTLGNGSADFEVESFGGTISLRKQGSASSAPGGEKPKGKKSTKGS